MSQEHTRIDNAADADLLTRVGIALTLRMSETSHALQVQVDRGHVTLRGFVHSYCDRQRAIEVTRHVAGVLRVFDEITMLGQSGHRSIHMARQIRHPSPSDESSQAATLPSTKTLKGLSHCLLGSIRWGTTHLATVLKSLFLVVGILGLTGCGSQEQSSVKLFPVTGSITFQGKPIPGAMLTLHRKNATGDVPNPRASVSQDGSFQVSTFAGGDGAPAGEYKLTVVWFKPIKKGNDIQAGPNVIPRQYASPQTSRLEVQVAEGPNQLSPIQL